MKGRGPGLTPDERASVRLVVELVDMLAARHGFDPAELISPRTGTPLGPVLARMRDALRDEDPARDAHGGHPL